MNNLFRHIIERHTQSNKTIKPRVRGLYERNTSNSFHTPLGSALSNNYSVEHEDVNISGPLQPEQDSPLGKHSSKKDLDHGNDLPLPKRKPQLIDDGSDSVNSKEENQNKDNTIVDKPESFFSFYQKEGNIEKRDSVYKPLLGKIKNEEKATGEQANLNKINNLSKNSKISAFNTITGSKESAIVKNTQRGSNTDENEVAAGKLKKVERTIKSGLGLTNRKKAGIKEPLTINPNLSHTLKENKNLTRQGNQNPGENQKNDKKGADSFNTISENKINLPDRDTKDNSPLKNQSTTNNESPAGMHFKIRGEAPASVRQQAINVTIGQIIVKANKVEKREIKPAKAFQPKISLNNYLNKK